jgi:hypothetical protein
MPDPWIKTPFSLHDTPLLLPGNSFTLPSTRFSRRSVLSSANDITALLPAWSTLTGTALITPVKDLGAICDHTNAGQVPGDTRRSDRRNHAGGGPQGALSAGSVSPRSDPARQEEGQKAA